VLRERAPTSSPTEAPSAAIDHRPDPLVNGGRDGSGSASPPSERSERHSVTAASATRLAVERAVRGRHRSADSPDDQTLGILRDLEGGPRLGVVGGWVPDNPARPRHNAGAVGQSDPWVDPPDDDVEHRPVDGPDAGEYEPEADSLNDTTVDDDTRDDDTLGKTTIDGASGAEDANDDGLADETTSGPAGRSVRGARRVGRPFGRFAELWVPEPLRDARVDPGRRGAVVLLLVAALAAVATAVGVWRDRPEPRPVETSAIAALAVPSAPDASPAAASGSDGPPVLVTAPSGLDATAAAASAEIVVSVTGLVASPGVVTLIPGSRVADAITAAGGAAPEADLTGMNLAARLADGDSVVVGSAPGADGATSGGVTSGVSGVGGGSGNSVADEPAGGLIDLNAADEAALDTLPGVGPVMAQNILAWRETNGRFTSIEQLQEISGIGPSRFAQISPLVMVS